MNIPTEASILVGDRLVHLTPEMSEALRAGGRLVPLRSSGEVLVIPARTRMIVDEVIDRAVEAFGRLQSLDAELVDQFFVRFAELIDDDAAFAPVLEANARDVASARSRGRGTGRLELSPKMRREMSDGLRMWANLDVERFGEISRVQHTGWAVESWRAPLGVVAFVFEGRPNVFADATGVLKSGNAVVFRIGSDALETARAIRTHLLEPALEAAGLPRGLVGLVDSTEHAAGWALFDDARVSLAVARGSGPAVRQLGEVARQAGVPVSLHGTGGAWMIVGTEFDAGRLAAVVENSLDRKVCNTLNTLVVLESNQSEALRAIGTGLVASAERHKGRLVVHGSNKQVRQAFQGLAGLEVRGDDVDPGHEWEWDATPEVSVLVAPNLVSAVALFNDHSPRFVLSVVTKDPKEESYGWAAADAPFFGDGFTRWVDGQFALMRPELGLANWQFGRLLGRGGVLSGDSVHTIRLRVRQADSGLHR